MKLTPPEIFLERPSEHAFTYEYSQPKEYHFCLDSIIFAYYVSRQFSEIAPAGDFRALDVCAGCGVVGIELAYYRKWMEHFDFVEIQGEVFKKHFERNRELSKNDDKAFRFIEADFRVLETEPYRESYDLVVANPPYFRLKEGAMPPHLVKRKARFFEGVEAADLYRALEAALKPGGCAFFLARPGEDHGRSLGAELQATLDARSTWRVAAEVRGTWVIEIKRSGIERRRVECPDQGAF